MKKKLLQEIALMIPNIFFIHDGTEFFYVNEYEFHKNGKPKKCIQQKYTKVTGDKK